MDNVTARRGIQSVEIAFRILTALQTSVRALPLKEIAALSELSPSATSNYMISLVRTGLVAADEKPGCYKLGPASLALGMSAINQLDGFDIVRREVIALRDATRSGAAVTAWAEDGPVSLFKQEGDARSMLELRTGLIPLVTTAAGKLFIACLQPARTEALISRELTAQQPLTPASLREEALAELRAHGFTSIHRADLGYVSVAAPIWDRDAELRFAISLIGTSATLDTDAQSDAVKALLDCANRATVALGGKVAR
ncbi:IclR family transcriptional regulator [Paraburkholderia oxyphila]|uniref:IclR family transcriptional regulator n=1 Tax=Paraburkholderia oxyphila TaxID=614212 RepID=UPI0004894ABA|nr:IclR family transcriptional regulator C-terminal domain-containing protein [Paraburkholderia oxyphila]